MPSGNFGNICAGLLAQHSGLPIKKFIAACNANDVVPQFLQTGIYNPVKAVATISNAMDVGDPSNFIRILEIFGQQVNDLTSILKGYTVTDDATRATILSVLQHHHYLLDPHGAVAFTALQQYLEENKFDKGVILETAHPVKFYDVIEPIINQPVPIPANITAQLQKEKKCTLIGADVNELKAFLSGL